ncbi:MAG TPA: beta-ketoacyl synthase N-terminal-like domain-containing protein, partial [Opitutaceae bacterium]|nr:beta-ketoacyl synthase N-terminal-like domain-containing protein [Opitutaceae bacterium]
MRRRRVKITGIGPVTPAGIGRAAFAAGILDGVSRTKNFSSGDPTHGNFVAASVEDFSLSSFVKRFPGQNGAARHTQFAIAASVLALRDAGISEREFQSSATAIMATGTSLMDCEGLKRSYDQVARLGVKGAYVRAVFSANVASIASTVANALSLAPRMMALQSSCCSGLDAIGYAAQEIADGKAEIALCGGTEAPLFSHPMIELRAAGLMSNSADEPEKQCRPFDLWRTTGVVSEGACMFILEPETSPRNAYAYIDGYAFSSDNHEDVCR